jgi:TonB-linked SusC/RagA family outer membrane protein
MKKTILIIQIITALFSTAALAQQKAVINGIVKDASGPLPGATVRELDLPGNGAATNGEGRFRLTLKGKTNTIIVHSVGYAEQRIKVTAGKLVEVIMQPAANSMDEVVVQGFGTKKRITNTGATSSIGGAEIRDIPTSAVQNTLDGRLPGMFTVQRSGQPGQDASDYFIRGESSLNPSGNEPLIIVDDIEYTYAQLAQINVNEIETITILKDASSTAIYGVKGANGVLIVTTRRGSLGVPKINLRVEGGLQAPVKTPTFLDSYQTASLRNEALSNDGLPSQFSQADLQDFATGADPYGHPNVDWYKAIFKPLAAQENTNLDISGGTSRVKYFISLGALNQGGDLRNFTDPLSLINSNYFYNRYDFRSNLDIQATKNLSLRFDVTERYGEINEPYQPDPTGEVYSYLDAAPYSAPFLNPNGTYSYLRNSPTQLPTLNGRLAALGYTFERNNDFNVLLGATEKLDAITKGLSFIARVAFASSSSITRTESRSVGPPAYYYNSTTGSYTISPQGDYVLAPLSLSGDNPLYTTNIDAQAYLNYDRTFGKSHISGLVLFNQTSETDRVIDSAGNPSLSAPIKFRGYSARVSYDYAAKYLFEFDGAYNGSARFANPFGFFPAVSAGWNIANEKFFKDATTDFQLLKLRASYGLVGSDVATGGQYLYQSSYYIGPNYYVGGNSGGTPSIYEGELVPTTGGQVTWEKDKKLDIGIDANMFKDKLSITVDYFAERRYDQLITPESVPGDIGIGISPVNLGVVSNKGADGQISYRPNIGKVQLNFSFVFSYAKNKIIYDGQPANEPANLNNTGYPIGQPFGYTWIGYYTSEADVAKSAKPPGLVVQPGDLKYADLNGDGQITPADESAIGDPNLPNTTYGLTLGANYKGFSISILLQGSQGYSFSVNTTGIEPFLSNLQPIDLQAWTPANAATAQFPRLTTITGGINSESAFPSTFYLINAKYLRLKTLELGYQLPQKLLPFKMNNARLYVSCYNLFTWDNYNLYQQDPEVQTNTAGDAYLNQRVVNLGVQVGF